MTELALENYSLIVFDKDGTLLDFDAMWGGWMEAVARGLESAAARPVTAQVYQAMGYDPVARRALPGQPLAICSMAELRRILLDVLATAGLDDASADGAVGAAWYAPDPVVLARPLADLPQLFGRLRQRGLKIAVVTSDDRSPTQATLEAVAAASLVDTLVCADDGWPLKPEPDMLAAACRELGVPPSAAIMVGDSTADLQMARAAGAGLAVGVTSGTSPAAVLAPYADLVLDSVAQLLDS